MTGKEIAILIAKLKEENKINTKQEQQFNNEWLACLYKAMANAL